MSDESKADKRRAELLRLAEVALHGILTGQAYMGTQDPARSAVNYALEVLAEIDHAEGNES